MLSDCSFPEHESNPSQARENKNSDSCATVPSIFSDGVLVNDEYEEDRSGHEKKGPKIIVMSKSYAVESLEVLGPCKEQAHGWYDSTGSAVAC
jgi:hypothetical protein